MAKENILFLAVLALIPVQLNKYFFIDSSYVLGIPIDYRALSIYLSDFFVLAFILISFLKNRLGLTEIYLRNKKLIITLIALNLYLLLNNFFKPGFPTTLFFALRVLFLSLFFLSAWLSLEDKKVRAYAYIIFSLSLVWQSALIISQFITAHSQNLLFLGERSFDTSTVNIAHINLFGMQLLRGYGTFPHPNVAGAYLALGLILKDVFAKNAGKRALRFNTVFTTLTALGLLLTFSRAAIIIYALYLLSKSKTLKSLIVKNTAFLIVLILLTSQLVNSQISSIAERITLTQVSLDIASKNLLFGVGNTNFLTSLAAYDLSSLAQTRLIQPVHNVFLLITAENGLIGFLLFIILLFLVSGKIKNKTHFFLFLSILIFATIDHFLWTLQQGQLLLWLTLATIASATRRESAL